MLLALIAAVALWAVMLAGVAAPLGDALARLDAARAAPFREERGAPGADMTATVERNLDARSGPCARISTACARHGRRP